MTCEGLEFLGAKISQERNNVRGKEAFINEPDSRVSIRSFRQRGLVIARDTRSCAIG
jgi:acetate kinase